LRAAATACAVARKRWPRLLVWLSWLGHGDQSSQRTPRLVTALLREMRVVQIAAGDANSLALDVDAVV
jgi:hypothetical protein